MNRGFADARAGQPVRRRLVLATALATATLGLAAVNHDSARGAASTEDRPDLQTIIPLSSFSVVTGTSGPEFRYTHYVFNHGPGPLQIQPEYNSASGQYAGRQQIYAYNTISRAWDQVSSRKVPDAFVFHAAHGHFHYPLASFGLYAVGAGGGPGAPVTLSPKNGFCIADSFIYDTSLPHAGETAVPPGSCSDPLTMRGMSVGGVDEYDYRDPGQAIPFTGVPDGTYWFRGMTDPNNDIAEADESNNETDVLVTISTSGGNRVVTAGEVRHPDTTPPPLTLTAPADNAAVSGNVTLTAAAAPGLSVQYLVDGALVGTSSATSAPYAFTWDSSTAVAGDHWIAARTTDALGRTNTSEVSLVHVSYSNPNPPPGGTLGVLAKASVDGGSPSTTPPMSNIPSGTLLLAFVAGDGPNSAGSQTATVTGGGLTWTLVRRANSMAGTSEIWRATPATNLPSLTATSTLAAGGFHQSVHLVALSGAGGTGVVGSGSASTGAPAVTVTTTKSGGWLWGVGNDWDNAVARVPRSGQAVDHQWVDSSTGDTFWMQYVTAPTPNAGTAVTFGDTAPTADRWNLAVVEVTPSASASPPPVDTQAPTVSVTSPTSGTTVTGIIQLGAVAADNVGVTSVQFKLDGTNLGAPVTAPPFATSWDTRLSSSGSHTITAEARDAAGNVGTTTAGVAVNVDNSAPPPAMITVDRTVNIHARGTLTSPALTTSVPGEVLLAFVALDGPASAGSQSSVVSGGGVTWTLVKRTNSQAGATEIWSAKATAVITNARVVATPVRSGYDGLLDVVAFKGAAGTGVAASSAAPTGAPDVYLPGVAPGSWVWAVGNDWDGAAARTPVSGQVLQHQWLDTAVGDTFWVQSTTAPNTASGLVTIHDSAPTNHQYNYTAAEVTAAPSS
jgi:hypothetical protein